MNLRNTTVRDLKKFLLIKFKDEDFLENLYEELDQIVEDKAQIPELTTDQLCNIIIENKLVEKLLNDETGGPIIKNQYNRMDDFEARQTHVLGYGRFDPQYQDARDCVKMRVILNQINNLNTKIGNQSEGECSEYQITKLGDSETKIIKISFRPFFTSILVDFHEIFG